MRVRWRVDTEDSESERHRQGTDVRMGRAYRFSKGRRTPAAHLTASATSLYFTNALCKETNVKFWGVGCVSMVVALIGNANGWDEATLDTGTVSGNGLGAELWGGDGYYPDVDASSGAAESVV